MATWQRSVGTCYPLDVLGRQGRCGMYATYTWQWQYQGVNSLANGGANFAQSFAITPPSQPNYLAFFSGSTQGITDDSCPHTFSANNLGAQLIAAGITR